MLLEINSVEIAHYPKTFSCKIMDLDYSGNQNFGRAIDGTLNRNRIATKRELTLTYSAIEWSDLSAVLQQMADEFFTVKYPDTYTGGYETKTFYVADRPANSVNTQMNVDTPGHTDDQMWWDGFTISLVEQ